MRKNKFANASLLLIKKSHRSVGNLILKLDINIFPAYNDTYFKNYVWLKIIILNSKC